MDITELKQELLDKKIRPFYVFTGDELALQDVYIDKIKEISELSLSYIDNVSNVYSKLTARTLFKCEPQIFICRNDEIYKQTEKSWQQFIDAKSLRGNILILRYSDEKANSSFSKKHEKVLTRFDFVSTSLLKNRLQAVTGMPLPYCEDIVKMCGNNYGRIQHELYKLGTYAALNGFSWNSAYLQAKKIDLIHENVGDIIFQFTDAILERNIKKAYNLWPKMKYTGDGTMRVLSVLYNSFRQVLMVQSSPDKLRTEEVLGMTKGQIYVSAQKCNRYNLFELVDIIKKLRYLEKGIKVGAVAEEFAMDYLMGEIW